MFTESHLDHEKTASWPSTLTALIGPVLLVLVLLGLTGKWWTAPRISAPASRNWEPALAQAELSKEKGDLYRAWSYYAEGAQLASAADDWQGLLAVACGLQKLGDSLEPSMNSHAMLMRAMIAAHRKQYRGAASRCDGLESLRGMVRFPCALAHPGELAFQEV